MIFGKSKLEFKVGVFVFVGLFILMVFVLFIGDFKTMMSAYKVDFIFNFVNGVKVGSPVRFAGVDIGEIREIKFLMNPGDIKPKILLVGWLRKEMRIPKDSQVWVNTLGLLGEKYVEIMPGKDYVNFLKAGDSVMGNDPFAMQEFGELAKSVATKMDTALVGVNDLAISVKKLADNLNDAVTKVKNQEGSLGKFVYGEQIYSDVELLVADLRRHPWKLFWKSKEKPVESKKK